MTETLTTKILSVNIGFWEEFGKTAKHLPAENLRLYSIIYMYVTHVQ